MRRVPLLLLSLVAIGAGSLVAPVVAEAAPASYDALAVTTHRYSGSSFLATSRVYEQPQITVTAADSEHFTSRGVDAAGHAASFTISPPAGRPFRSNDIFNLDATRSANRGTAEAISGDVSCSPGQGDYGFVRVGQASTAPDGTLQSLSLSFELRCGSLDWDGLLRYRSPESWSMLRTDTELPDLGAVVLGHSVTRAIRISVVGQGSEPLTEPYLSASADSGITQLANTCGDTVDVGDVCTLTVRFAPRRAGTHTATFFYFDRDTLACPCVGFTGTGIDTQLGTFHPTGPTRVLDTRGDVGGHRGALGPGDSVVVRPGTGSDPASAYVLNLTAVSPTASGYLTAYPTGKAVPGTASVNLAGGRTVAHLVTVPAGADGSVTIRNAAGSTHVVADLVGWYSADDGPLAAGATRGGGYHRGGVQRLLDTRSGLAVQARQYVTVSARYPGRHVAALAVNVTVTAPLASGYVTAWNAASDTPPLASTLNFNRGETVSNAAIVPASACTTAAGCNDSATIAIANGSGGGVHVIVDVTGYFDDGGVTADVRFHPLTTPTRIVDTRTSLGTTPFLAGETHAFDPAVVGPDTIALDGDATAVRPTRSTYLTVWPDTIGYQRPRASTVNAAPGRVVGNHVLAAVGGDRGSLNVYNFTGNVDVVADVDGTFDAFPPSPPDGIQRLRDAFLPTSDSPVRPVYRPVR